METFITDSWNEYLQYYKDERKDIYYEEEYVKLYETSEAKALCAVCKDENKILLMPFIRREKNGYFDFETAYGYGGPIANIEKQDWIDCALDKMKYLFEKENYVCGFIRFHTLLENERMCRNHMQVIFDRNTVAINTEQTENEIWLKQFNSKNRNMIRKAEKNGLVYKAEYDFESLEQFVKLYNATMKRVKAEDFYFFDSQYYQSYVKNFNSKSFLGTVKKNGELVCAALFMYSKDYGHYHLEGSNYAYSNLAANNLLLWKTALEFRKLGVKEFHLGGGYDGRPDNSLLKFKKSFNSDMKNFYIGKWIFNQEKYSELKNNWMKNNPEKIEKSGQLLLCYRR